MSAGDLERLNNWANNHSRSIDIQRMPHASGVTWVMSVAAARRGIGFKAHGEGKTPDDAAAEVIAQLEAVGETMPTD